jgi:beta-galactosidase/beta-glucuronidase
MGDRPGHGTLAVERQQLREPARTGRDFRIFPSYPAAWESVEMGWLRRTVQVPSGWKGDRVLLHFAAVAGDVRILVNGKDAGKSFDIFFPFDVDITSVAAPGQDIEILVGLRKPSLFDHRWTSLSGKDGVEASAPLWKLEPPVEVNLTSPQVQVAAHQETTVTLQARVDSQLALWSPEQANLYGLIVDVKSGGHILDLNKAKRMGGNLH